jgi:hypothetical protein
MYFLYQQQLIASKTLSEDEASSLRHHKAADNKLRNLLKIVTDHSNRKELKAFKTFIDILHHTGNIDIAQQILPIYNERVRSSHLIYNFRVRTDLIYTYLYSHSKITVYVPLMTDYPLKSGAKYKSRE